MTSTVKVEAQMFDNILKQELIKGKLTITSRLRAQLGKFFHEWPEVSVIGSILDIDDNKEYMELYDSNVFAFLSVIPLREALSLHIAHLREITHTNKTKTSGGSPMFDENYSFLKKVLNILNQELERLKNKKTGDGAELKGWVVVFTSQIGLLQSMAIRAKNKQS